MEVIVVKVEVRRSEGGLIEAIGRSKEDQTEVEWRLEVRERS